MRPQPPMPSRRDLASPSLLSPAGYDDDASVRSLSEQDSDTEDDEFLRNSRTTLELAEYDRGVLDEEEEMEKLLTRGGPSHGLRRIFSPNGSSVRIGKPEQRRQRRKERQERRRRRKEVREDGELMYEMEEGNGDDAASLLSSPSSMLDPQEKGEYVFVQPRRIAWWKLILISAAILVLFLIFLLGAYKASSNFRASHTHRPLMSNGSALFAPTTILISLDGFRPDYLDCGLTPSLNALVASGVSPKYMLPSFPSVTFPNHFTLVTGLYPESHGVVGNNFWDPVLKEEFYNTRPSISSQAKWWNAEPLWVTAENEGLKTAIHMWPGSESNLGDMDPTYLVKYNGSEAYSRKADRILELLDLPGEEDETQVISKRPQFIASYLPNIDTDGHNYGPNSTEVRKTISEVDQALGYLFAGIQKRNLTDIVNIVIVSDHGMATTSNERLVQLDDFIDLNLVDHIDGWPSRGLRPKRPEDLDTLKTQLESVAENYSHAVEIYTLETMPERYHFTNNDRIAPLWVIPKAGWAIVERPEFDVQEATRMGQTYHPKGIHGYDFEHPLMRAIFMARGPAFPHEPNSRLEPFQNINVYNIICDSIGVEPLPNNGTLRLPLHPVGLHSDEHAPVLDSPQDPPSSTTTSSHVPTTTATVISPQVTSPESENTAEKQPETDPESDDEKGPTWWGTLWNKVEDKVEDIKDWAGELIDSVKDNIHHSVSV